MLSKISTLHGVPMGYFRCLFDAFRVSDDKTPHSLGVKDGDLLSLHAPQHGGLS